MNSTPELFTTIRIEDGKPILLHEHLTKLQCDYKKVHNENINLEPKDIRNFLKKEIPLKGTYRLNIYTNDISKPKLRIEPPYKKSLSLKIHPSPFYEIYPNVKKEDFTKRLELLKKAKSLDCDDLIFTNEKGYFLETAIYNLFWIQGNNCYTPCPDLPIYFGITIEMTLRALENLGFDINYVYESDPKILEKSFLFAVNSMKELCSVHTLNQKQLPQDKNLQQSIYAAYRLVVEDLDVHRSTCPSNPVKCDTSLPL